MEAAAAMDFNALSRRELQALCKRNGVRANMTNAAMAEALQGLTSVSPRSRIRVDELVPDFSFASSIVPQFVSMKFGRGSSCEAFWGWDGC